MGASSFSFPWYFHRTEAKSRKKGEHKERKNRSRAGLPQSRGGKIFGLEWIEPLHHPPASRNHMWSKGKIFYGNLTRDVEGQARLSGRVLPGRVSGEGLQEAADPPRPWHPS